MPLSPADVQFINKLLDRHLKNARAWPRFRFAQLGMGVLLIVIGLAGMAWSGSLAIHTLDYAPPATRAASTSAAPSQPITYAQLRDALDSRDAMADWHSRFNAYMSTAALAFALESYLVFFGGLFLTGAIISRWNRHRRDTILITLLREKCAAELAMPAPAAGAA